MRIMLAGVSALAILGACQPRSDETGARTDRERSGVDTAINTGTIKDTTVVRADTSIDVDTLKKTDNIEKARNR